MENTHTIASYIKRLDRLENQADHKYMQTHNSIFQQKYRYLLFIMSQLNNFDADDRITIDYNGKYSIRRDGREINYGRLNSQFIH